MTLHTRHLLAPTVLLLLAVAPAHAQVTLASLSTAHVAGNGHSTAPSISGDGRYVAFESTASNLADNDVNGTGDTNGVADVFVRDRRAGTTRRISARTNLAGAVIQADGGSTQPAISDNGRFVAFTSTATNLVSGDTNNASDVFVHDLQTGAITRVSVASGGSQATGASSRPDISADGRYVVFESTASNLGCADANGTTDIVVHDRQAGTTSCVSVASGGATGNDASFEPAISDDGDVVAFHSFSTNLVTGDLNNTADVFVRRRSTSATTKLSGGTGASQANGPSLSPAISGDGTVVAFTSSATNLVSPDINGQIDVFLVTVANRATARVSIDRIGQQLDGACTDVSLDLRGGTVVFTSAATDAVYFDTNASRDVFVHTVATGRTARVSVNRDGGQAGGASGAASVNSNGSLVAFSSDAADVVPGDTNARTDVYVHDLDMYLTVSATSVAANPFASSEPRLSPSGRTVVMVSLAPLAPGDTNGVYDVYLWDFPTDAFTRVSLGTAGQQGNGASYQPAMSADGRFVVFASDATNLVPDDNNGRPDVFVHDRVTLTTTRVSVGQGGAEANGSSQRPRLSADGRYVSFESLASNLVPGDAGGWWDVYVHDRITGATTCESRSSAQVTGNGDSLDASISASGRYVAFESNATNLAGGDGNGTTDVFLRDRDTGSTRRISVSSTGVEGNGASRGADVSDEGRIVAFESDASSLSGGDLNNATDVFVHDTATQTTTRVTTTPSGAAPNGPSRSPAISGNGRVVAFLSSATNLVVGDTNAGEDVFAFDATEGMRRVSLGSHQEQPNGIVTSPSVDQTGAAIAFDALVRNITVDPNPARDVLVRYAVAGTPTLTPAIGTTAGGTTVTIDGGFFHPGLEVLFGGVAGTVTGVTPSTITVTSPAHVEGHVAVSVTVPGHDSREVAGGFSFVGSPAPTDDRDGDGMLDGLEVRYGLDPFDPADGGLDPDGDGVSSLSEIRNGTHPRGFHLRYLAEGATSTFFTTELALLNYGERPASVLLRFQKADGTTIARPLDMPPGTRATVDAGTIAGLETAEFSTVLESDEPIVLDRALTWDRSGYGRHAETATSAPRATWYLAEGATHSGFELFYLLQNPNAAGVTATVTFLRPAPLPPIVKTYAVPARSRFNVWVNQADPGLAATDVSATIAATGPIIVERALYLSNQGRAFNAGHESLGVDSPALQWHLAEGATGSYFDLFVLVANPSTAAAEIDARFLKPDGSVITKAYTVAPQSRFNIWVDTVDPQLADTAVSTTIRATNGIPVIVERALWWPGTAATWAEAHNSAGATDIAGRWATAGGEDGGPLDAQTYLLVANLRDVDEAIDVTVIFEDGTSVKRGFTVGARSRFNVSVRNEFPEAAGRRFGAVIGSDVYEAQLIVETSVYANAGGVSWAAGSNMLASPIRE